MTYRKDKVFTIAKQRDPFTEDGGNPYLLALMKLPIKQRWIIARQAVLLCAVVEGLDPLGALEVIAAIGQRLKVDGERVYFSCDGLSGEGEKKDKPHKKNGAKAASNPR